MRPKIAGAVSKKEIDASQLVRDLQRRLAYELDHGIKIAIKNECINNIPVTTRDVDNSTIYLGRNISSLKEKTSSSLPLTYLMIDATRFNVVPQKIEIDLMFIDQHAFLISLSEPLDLIMIS